MAYALFKFLHVAGAIFWVGGVSTLTILNARLARDDGEPAVQAALARRAGELGRLVIGPAALITLAAGITTAIVGGISMGTLWITWGFTGILVSMGLAGTAGRRTTNALAAALAEPATPAARATALRSRLNLLNLLNLAILLSVVGAMVFKPTM